jgi:hypothetical protein
VNVWGNLAASRAAAIDPGRLCRKSENTARSRARSRFRALQSRDRQEAVVLRSRKFLIPAAAS